MAGHSKFKNIVHRKNLQDRKRALNFTRVMREISIAARSGSDAKTNFRLRMAIVNARKNNIPKDTIENTIKKASGEKSGISNEYEDILYEGYGPFGSAILIETLTNNRNRTSGEVRTILNKSGGSLGVTGSAAYLFDRIAILTYDKKLINDEKVIEDLLNSNITDYYESDDKTIIECEVKSSEEIREKLERHDYIAEELEVTWKPKGPITLNEKESIEKIKNVISLLEENDDVYSVTTNVDIQ